MMASPTTNKATNKKRGPAEEVGIVASDKMMKTIVVNLVRRVKHPKYGKYFTKTKRIKVHDEKNEAKIGDQVLVVESRPLSKDKRYALKQILRKAKI